MAVPLTAQQFTAFQGLIHDAAGIFLAPNKRDLLASRMARRLEALGITDYATYYELLRTDPSGSEREQFVNCVTTNKTNFFREPHHFDFLRQRVIPELRARVAAGAPRRLRLWSAACSSGEEPYSLAMVAHQELARDGYAIEIMASDIDTEVLAVAQAGSYSPDLVAEIPIEYRSRYLQRATSGWQVVGEIRALVQLHRLNLLRDAFPFPGAFDAMFVRNVIIYFDRAGQTALFQRLRPYLAETGYLFLGHSESLLHITQAFVPAGQTIYRRTPGTAPSATTPGAPPVAPPATPVRAAAPPRGAIAAASVGAAAGKGRIKVLVVDDSALMRKLLQQLLSRDPEIEVIATAPDPFAAWEQIKRERPDVITLDVEMPRMDGLSFLARLMAHYPIPVVMVSSITQANCEASLRALELGAVEVFAKPTSNVLDGVSSAASELIEKVRIAARARIRKLSAAAGPAAARPAGYGLGGGVVRTTHQIIAIGASTGGTEAIREVLTTFPPDAPGVVVVQHMPARFTAAFAERLDRLCQIRVREAQHGDRVLPGHALIAPGGHHLSVVRSGAVCTVVIDDTPPVNRHRPSVDVLFASCARQLGRNAVGVLLTGMGADGAAGLKAMRDAGAHTMAQDEASCVVFGMPREAIEAGAAVEVVALDAIGPALWARPRA